MLTHIFYQIIFFNVTTRYFQISESQILDILI